MIEPLPVSDRRAVVQIVQGEPSTVDKRQVPQEVSASLVVVPAAAPVEPGRVDIGRITPMEVSKVTELPPAPPPANQVALAPASALPPSGSSPVTAPTKPAPGQGRSAEFHLEVANGNGITGMAHRVGHALVEVGYPASRLTNQKPFQQAATQIQYRDGYAQEAQALRKYFSQPPEMVARTGLPTRTDVRIVLGHDLPRTFALNLDATPALQLAAAAKN